VVSGKLLAQVGLNDMSTATAFIDSSSVLCLGLVLKETQTYINNEIN
jgi:hypothetical protein